ncbi:MAG: hypothetical protein CME64_12015 [Halobacteriovoraceae bacterium]|nr:hypothetical protein [Halobacteriovoraceae bacterium]|tara:strand:+ start:288913 stop:289683 length:771 start_codon:yes stop_codon:yes gene_type:complete
MNIVLLRGLVREQRHWGEFKDLVAKTFPQAKVLLLDIPGTGTRCDELSPSNFDQMISQIREEYLSKKAPGSTTIIAQSLGGMLAKRWSELHPQEFDRMILINSSFKGINPIHKRLRPKAWLDFLNIFINQKLEQREKLILKLVSNDIEKQNENLKSWCEIQTSAPVKKVSFINQILAAVTFNPSKIAPDTQLMLIASKGDRLCSYECSMELSKRWGVPVELHPDAGHDLPIDAPNWLIERIESFIHSPGSNHSKSS